jgi:DNA-binding CsgD family transcriptional regulator
VLGYSRKDLRLILRKVQKTLSEGFPVLVNQTIEEPLPKIRVPGFSRRDLSLILRKVHKTVSGRFQVLVNQTIEELMPKQQGMPLKLSEGDLQRLAARHGATVQVAAATLLTELCDGASKREALTERHLDQIGEAVRLYRDELTSAKSAKDLLATAVVRYFTVARLNEAERRLAKLMRRTRFRKAVAKDAEEELAYVHAKFGIKRGAVRRRRVVRAPLPAKQQDLSQYFDAAKLTERQREVLSLRYEHSLTIAHIAGRLGLHRKTVDEHLQSAEVKLRSAKAAWSSARNRAKTEPGNLR